MHTLGPQKELKKFRELIESIKTGILITRSSNDQLKGRPMNTAQVDKDGHLWFFISEFSKKANDIIKSDEVFLTYASAANNSYIVITGAGTISNNKEKMKELWNPLLKTWFPEGLETPGIALLMVEPDEVEYWDGSASKIVVLFKMLSAMVSGTEYKNGEHKKVVSD